MIFNPYSIPHLIVAIFYVISGIYIYLKNRHSMINIILALEWFCVFIWNIGYFFMYSTKNENIAAIYAKFIYIGIVFIPSLFYHFTVVILKINNEKNIVKLNYFISSVILFFILTTNRIVSGVWTYFFGFHTKVTSLHYFYLAFFFVLFIRCFIKFYKAYKNKRDKSPGEYNQIRYIFVGFFIASFGIFDFLAHHGILEFFPVGFLFVAVAFMIIHYVIIRHRLLDVNVALTRAGIFIFVYLFILGVPFVFGYKYRLWQLATWVTVILATSGPFIYLFLQRRAEKILRKEQLIYQQALRNTSSTIMLNKDLNKLLETIVLNVVDIVKVNWAAIYLKSEKEDKYLQQYHHSKTGEESLPKEFTLDSELVKRLYSSKLPLIGEENHFQELKIGLAVPSFQDSNLIGFLLLGDKPKGKIYDQSDVNEFTLLSNQFALAIENCQFYSQERQRQQYMRVNSLDRQMAGLAHEIDNPNSALLGSLGSLELVLDDLKEVIPADKMEYLKKKLDRARFNSKRISKMITSVREFSRASTGEVIPLKFEWIMEGLLNIIEPQFKYNGVNFIQEVPSESIWLRANKVEIEQVLVNLGTNSTQAINEIWLKGHNTPESKKEITLKAYPINPNTLRIDFTDTGGGIKKELLEDIFLDFVTTKGSAEGTGLGLSISRKIIQKHNGKIWAESEVMGSFN